MNDEENKINNPATSTSTVAPSLNDDNSPASGISHLEQGDYNCTDNTQSQEREDIFYVAENDEPPSQHPSPLPEEKRAMILLFKVILSPVEGWKELKRSRISPDKFAQGCYYPLLAIMATSVFAMLFYISNTPIQTLLVEAIISFISFFLGYFTVGVALRMLTPQYYAKAFATDFGNCFVMASMSTLAIVQTLINLLPFIQPVLVFLPLYTIYLIVKGIRFLRIERKHEGAAIAAVSILSIGVPLLLQWIFSMMLPG